MSSSVPSPVHRPTLSKVDIPSAPKYDVPPAHHRFLALPDSATGSPSAPGSPAENLSLNDVSAPTSRSGSPVRQARTYSSACHRTGMTPMQSGDVKFQSLRSEYETAFRLIHVTMDALPAIVQALKRELRRVGIDFRKCSVSQPDGEASPIDGSPTILLLSERPLSIIRCKEILENVLITFEPASLKAATQTMLVDWSTSNMYKMLSRNNSEVTTPISPDVMA